MKNRSTLKAFIAIGIVVMLAAVILVNVYRLTSLSTKQLLNSLVQESPDYPAYNSLAHFYVDGSSIDWYDVLQDNEIEGQFAEVLVVYNDRIFFVVEERCDSGIGKMWRLLSVNKKGENLLTHLNENFGLDGGDNAYQCNNACRDAFWESKNGFYHNGKIILTDHVKLVEYDIENGNMTLMSSSEHVYPENEVGVIKKDSQTLLVDYMGIQRTITPDALKRSSQAFTSFMELRQKETWDGRSRLERLFTNVQSDGENIYVICSAYNWSGETYAVVFQFDMQEDNCNYSFYQYVIDSVDERFYLVPVESSTEDSLRKLK